MSHVLRQEGAGRYPLPAAPTPVSLPPRPVSLSIFYFCPDFQNTFFSSWFVSPL